MITKKQPNAWEIKRTVGVGVGGCRELFWAPRRESGIEGVPTAWLRLSDVKGILWISKRQLFQLLPEDG